MRMEVLVFAVLMGGTASARLLGDTPASRMSATGEGVIAWEQLGEAAAAAYAGDGIGIRPVTGGAELRCVLQRLQGHATGEGLWIQSTSPDEGGGRFLIVASGVGRVGGATTALAGTGTVVVTSDLACYVRPRLVEEYRVGADGIRQDFVVEESPAGDGPLRVELRLEGARAAQHGETVQLELGGSGRRLAYGQLRATDARERVLTARLLVEAPDRVAVVVDDAAAAYPIRIDPTVTDKDWSPLGSGFPANVRALAVAPSGILYAGGEFTNTGSQVIMYLAQWNGSAWSSVGGGLENDVESMAIDAAGNLYVGGSFNKAGGVSAEHIAKWNGASWSALGTGMDGDVEALAVFGSLVYAGGDFTNAGGVAARHVACWNGTSWSALGAGTDDSVSALATDDSGNLYVGGLFTTAGPLATARIARWNGAAWSALGSGVNGDVEALLCDAGGRLYAGGEFNMAGGASARHLAVWNGSAWGTLGNGLNNDVEALAIDAAGMLYAGGTFTNAGVAASYLARWNGAAWEALGTGLNDRVRALAADARGWVFVGGDFTGAGGKAAAGVALLRGSGLWTGSSDVGGGWLFSPWFGYVVPAGEPWIYHAQHGWLYAFGIDATSVAFWDSSMAAYWWTGSGFYSYLYRYSDGEWLWYQPNSDNPRWFVRLSDSIWEPH